MTLTSKQWDEGKLLQLKEVVVSNALDVGDLCTLLELSVEDMLEKFEDKLLEHSDKFVPNGFVEEEVSKWLEDSEDVVDADKR